MTRDLRAATAAIFLACLLAGPAMAGEADVVGVEVRQDGAGRYAFDVTVRHADAGWDHYANAWEVVSVDGKTVYGTRTLLHPHDTEQPFTRALSGVAIPDGVEAVVVRARDSVHGFGGKEMTVKIRR